MQPIVQYLRAKIRSNPVGLYVLFYTEMWECFGRFGIISLLVLYLTHSFKLSDSYAFSIYSGFLALIYVTPIICGQIADRFLGLKHAVILGGFMMIIGNLLMVIEVPSMVYLGLSIVAVGSGFFLPSIVPLVGNLYHVDDRRRDAGFTLYYIGKNIGALLAPILCGIVAVCYGYHYAFILSAIGMMTGMVIFIRGHKHLRLSAMQNEIEYSTEHKYHKKSKKGHLLSYVMALALIPVTQLILVKEIDGYLLLGAGILVVILLSYLALSHSRVDRSRIAMISLMMVFVMGFGAFLNQGGTTLNLFIERIIDRNVLGFNLPTTFFYTLDPVFMIILGPFIAALWMKLAQKNKEPSEPTKFSFAMIFLAMGFGVFVLAALQGVKVGHASPLYIVLAYFLFPLAELLIMPIGLSLVTKLAPKDMEASLVGVWMLANAGASYMTGIISKWGEINFSYQNVEGLKQASEIYSRDFGLSAISLILIALVLILAVRALYIRWIHE